MKVPSPGGSFLVIFPVSVNFGLFKDCSFFLLVEKTDTLYKMTRIRLMIKYHNLRKKIACLLPLKAEELWYNYYLHFHKADQA